MEKMNVISINSGYQTSDWKRFLKCWHDRYKEVHGSIDGSVISKHDITSNFLPDIKLLEERIALNLPQSLRDFLSSYRPCEEWVKGGVRGFDSFMLPLSEIKYLREYDSKLYNVWASEEQAASDDVYYRYGPEQDDAVFRSYQYEYLVVLGRTSLSDFIMLNPCVRTADGEMEIVLHSSASIHRTLSFSAMMRSIYCYECESPDSYPPYKHEFLNSGCASIMYGNL